MLRGARECARVTRAIEVLNLNPPVKKAIILLLPRTHIKVLKDTLHGILGSILDLKLGSGQ
jgi:hypothetical protein